MRRSNSAAVGGLSASMQWQRGKSGRPGLRGTVTLLVGMVCLLWMSGCNGPAPVPPIFTPMTEARHTAEEFPIAHGEAENATHDCAPCHGGLSSFSLFTCLSCHAHVKAQTDEAHAVVAAYAYESTACYGCHPAGTTVSRDDHTYFPIDTGDVHQDASCESCHTTSNTKEYSCIDCHEHAQAPMDTSHSSVFGYTYNSSACLSCHPDGTAVFREEHTDFPIATGSVHQEASCDSCHTTASYQEFSCIDCHEHAQAETDPDHTSVVGYEYASNACLSCHPDGTAVSREEHTDFPIAAGSTHEDSACDQCHVTSNYQEFSCIDCHEHAKSTMDAEHAAVYSYMYESMSCLSCHPDGIAISRQEHTYFPITSGAHKIYDCQDCHQDAQTYKTNTCIGCHDGEHTCSKMNKEHDEVGKYKCEDSACLSCHPKGVADD